VYKSLPQAAQRKTIFSHHIVMVELDQYHFHYEPDAASYPLPGYEAGVMFNTIQMVPTYQTMLFHNPEDSQYGTCTLEGVGV
jgi:hypothetical protein